MPQSENRAGGTPVQRASFPLAANKTNILRVHTHPARPALWLFTSAESGEAGSSVLNAPSDGSIWSWAGSERLLITALIIVLMMLNNSIPTVLLLRGRHRARAQSTRRCWLLLLFSLSLSFSLLFFVVVDLRQRKGEASICCSTY